MVVICFSLITVGVFFVVIVVILKLLGSCRLAQENAGGSRVSQLLTGLVCVCFPEV